MTVESVHSKGISTLADAVQGAERLPEGREWRCELKMDGYRAIGRKSGRTTQL